MRSGLIERPKLASTSRIKPEDLAVLADQLEAQGEVLNHLLGQSKKRIDPRAVTYSFSCDEDYLDTPCVIKIGSVFRRYRQLRDATVSLLGQTMDEPAAWSLISYPLQSTSVVQTGAPLLWSQCYGWHSAGHGTDARTQYRWQDRLAELRAWRGEAKVEAESLSPVALAIAEGFCLYADKRFAFRGVTLPTILSGLSDGGVQVEWSLRNAFVYHLELEIPPDFNDRVALLRTRESLDGQILTAYEVAESTIPEALKELEVLSELAERYHQWTPLKGAFR